MQALVVWTSLLRACRLRGIACCLARCSCACILGLLRYRRRCRRSSMEIEVGTVSCDMPAVLTCCKPGVQALPQRCST